VSYEGAVRNVFLFSLQLSYTGVVEKKQSIFTREGAVYKESLDSPLSLIQAEALFSDSPNF
jgi:hypothetical protein